MITCTFEDGNKAQPGLRHVVIDTLVLKNNDEILLVKRTKKLLEGGKWGLIGGYLDRDETIVNAVAREVLEETGYKVSNITLLSIIDKPNRPHEDRQNISFVFFATAAEKVGEHDWEVDDQKWFELDALPSNDELAFDHSEMILLYKKYQKENLILPIL